MKNRIPKSAITEKQLRRLLREAAEDSTLSAWAVDNGIVPQAVSAFMRKAQSAGLQIPKALGYYPQVIFLPVDEDPIMSKPPSRVKVSKPTRKKRR